MRKYIDNNDERWNLKKKIINIYEYILEKFCKWLIRFEASIKTMKRGVLLPNGEEYYEDYFSSTHTEIKEKIKTEKKETPHSMLMVIKIATNKDEEILFSTDIKKGATRDDIIYLDDALNMTPKPMKHLFYKKIDELKSEERIFRERKRMESIVVPTQQQVLQWLMIK